MNITGTVHKVFDAKQITERFKKREIVLLLEPNSKWPQMVPFEVTGDRCSMLDGFTVGDNVVIEFRLNGREWTSPKTGEVKYFGSLVIMDIYRQGNAGPKPEDSVTSPSEDGMPF